MIAVLCQVDDFGLGPENTDSVGLEVGCKVQRRLAAELRDDADRLFFVVDGQNILQGKGLKIELVGGVIVSGNCLRVAVDDDGLKAQLMERLGRMDAAVVKLDTLADPVGAAAQDHDLGTVSGNGIVIRRVVCGIVVSAVLCAADMDCIPCLDDAELFALMADLALRDVKDLAQIFVRETVLLGLYESLGSERTAEQGFFFLHQFLHLVDEIVLYTGEIEDLIGSSSLAQGFIHDKIALAVRNYEELKEFLLAELMEVLYITQAIAVFFKGTDRLLEGLFVVLADAHDFADRAHLCAEVVIDALEFFKCPAGEFNDYVVAVRNIFIESPVFAAGKLAKCETCGELGGYQSDRETGCLGCQSGGAGCPGIDLNDDHAAALGIVGELHVCAADDADVFDDLVGLLLELFLQIFIDREHGSSAEGITCMDADGIDVLDEADGDHIVVLVADNFKLELFPAEDGLLYKDLMDQAGLETARADCAELILIVDKSAAGAAHSVGGAKNNRIAELISDRKRFLYRVCNFASGHLDAELIHCFLKFNSVFSALNSIDLNADDFYAVFIKNSFFIKF